MKEMDLVMLQLFFHCKIHLTVHQNSACLWDTDESFDSIVLILQCVFLDPKCPLSYICILKYCIQMLSL